LIPAKVDDQLSRQRLRARLAVSETVAEFLEDITTIARL
jgi:hypothetical protein